MYKNECFCLTWGLRSHWQPSEWACCGGVSFNSAATGGGSLTLRRSWLRASPAKVGRRTHSIKSPKRCKLMRQPRALIASTCATRAHRLMRKNFLTRESIFSSSIFGWKRDGRERNNRCWGGKRKRAGGGENYIFGGRDECVSLAASSSKF